MKRQLTWIAALFFFLPIIKTAAASQESFEDTLVLNPDETCSVGVPASGDVIALALRGAKGRNYVRAGSAEVPRMAVRGRPSDAFSVFQFVEGPDGNAVALYSLGHQKYVAMDDRTRLFANAEASGALLFQLEDTGEGYVRLKLNDFAFWMNMNPNGYLSFRGRQPEDAAEFCAQIVQAG